MNAKKILGLIILSLISLNAYSQLGITGGVNLSSLKGEDYSGKYSYGIGGQAGLFYDLQLSNKFWLKPQFLFLFEEFGQDSRTENTGNKTSINSFDMSLPILLTYKHSFQGNKNFFIGLGTFVSCGIAGTIKKEFKDREKISDLYPNEKGIFDFGWMGGIGYEIEKYSFSLQYKQGLYNLMDAKQSSSFLFSVGYRIEKNK